MTVDRIVERESREAECRTQEIQLGLPAEEGDLPETAGVDAESRELLAGRYGHAARGVLELAAERPELARRIVPDLPDLLAEAPFAARHEQALGIADVLMRRTRLAALAGPELVGEAAGAPHDVAQAMARELGWNDADVERELAAWGELAVAEGIAGP